MKIIRKIRCPRHGIVELDPQEYMRQLSRPNDLWRCPECGKESWWLGEFMHCLAPDCDGIVEIDGADVCPVCGRYQEELYLELGCDGENAE